MEFRSDVLKMLHLPQQPGASLVALAEVPSVAEVGASDVVSGLPAHST